MEIKNICPEITAFEASYYEYRKRKLELKKQLRSLQVAIKFSESHLSRLRSTPLVSTTLEDVEEEDGMVEEEVG